MKQNLLEYAENAAVVFSGRIAFSGGETGETLTFSELWAHASSIGSGLLSYGRRRPIGVFVRKGPMAIAAFLGVLASGNCYIPLDEEMSFPRIADILEKARPCAVICDAVTMPLMEICGYSKIVLDITVLLRTPIDAQGLEEAKSGILETDPAHIIFTSGSTGTPKGVVASHRNVAWYLEAFCDIVAPSADRVFGMQSPLYVDAGLAEIWYPLKTGARTVLLPKSLFMTPVKLVEYMDRHGVNTISWVASALSLFVRLRALERVTPRIDTVIFGSEALPPAHFDAWRAALPDARYLNFYGPTECTGFCCYFEVPVGFRADARIPIGVPFAGARVFLLDDDALVTETGRQGEIHVCGPGVTLGYYGDKERTAETFIQNPLSGAYPETTYRTGDIAEYDADGNLVFLSRRDGQIKHMGYRIELAEIENRALCIAGIGSVCCVYAREQERIVLFYDGVIDPPTLNAELRARLPRYMLPAKTEKLNELPLTQNGKMDRAGLLERVAPMYQKEKR